MIKSEHIQFEKHATISVEYVIFLSSFQNQVLKHTELQFYLLYNNMGVANCGNILMFG
jgi:hypothetical protein